MPSSNVLLPSVSIAHTGVQDDGANTYAFLSQLELLSVQCPGSIAIGDMHLLLFEGAAHLSSQFIEKLPDGAIIKIAGVLRENLTCENGNRLAMARGFTSRSGIEDLAAGKQPG